MGIGKTLEAHNGQRKMQLLAATLNETEAIEGYMDTEGIRHIIARRWHV